jgi:hypothetical protein
MILRRRWSGGKAPGANHSRLLTLQQDPSHYDPPLGRALALHAVVRFVAPLRLGRQGLVRLLPHAVPHPLRHPPSRHPLPRRSRSHLLGSHRARLHHLPPHQLPHRLVSVALAFLPFPFGEGEVADFLFSLHHQTGLPTTSSTASVSSSASGSGTDSSSQSPTQPARSL